MSKEVITPEQLFEALVTYNYVIFKDGKLIVTDNFHREFGDPSRFALKREIDAAAQKPILVPAVVEKPTEVAVSTTISPIFVPEESILTRLILAANVPKTAKSKTGTYAVNKFNAKAEKILEKAITKDKFNFDVIVMATKIYYKSGVMPKTIANFFIEGIWREEYTDLATALNEGNKKAQEYINNRVKEGAVNEDGASRYKR